MSKPQNSVDQYTQLKNQLAQQISKKQELDSQLQALESSIYEKENDYFNESTYGNIVKGFDSFAKSSSGGSSKRKMVYTDDDHIFSLLSATFVRTLMKRQGNSGPDYDDFEDSAEPPSNGTPNGNKEQLGTPGRKRKNRLEETK